MTLFKSVNYFSKSSFLNLKSNLCAYLKETYGEDASNTLSLIESIRHSDIDIENDVESYYFFSYDEFHYTVDKHIDIVCGYHNQISRLLTKVFLTLGWFGITLDDALQIRKSDVDPEGNINVNGVLFQLPAKVQKLVLQFKDMEEFTVLAANGKQMTFTMVDSGYLFRTTTTDVVSKSGIRVKIKELSTEETFSYTDKKLSFEKVAVSGVFYRALQDELKNGAVYRITGNDRMVVLDRERAEQLLKSEYLKSKIIGDKLRLYDVYKKIAMQTM
jgi:hypothetical protein